MESSTTILLVTLLVLLSLHPSVSTPYDEYLTGHDDIAKFRLLNRRSLADCSGSYPYLSIDANPNSSLPNEVNVTVTVSGVPDPNELDWVAMITPSNASVTGGCNVAGNYYLTGDVSILPLLCHYPVKAQYMKNDPSYVSCKKKTCHQKLGDDCTNQTCSGSITFHVINIRTEIEFVFFANGFNESCMLKRSSPIHFAFPAMSLYGHLSSTDSTGTSMRLTWISENERPQEVQYGSELKSAPSEVITFTQDDMCDPVDFIIHIPSPAKDFGWHHPGYIHSAIMTGLKPSYTYTYRYGSELVGWSDNIGFNIPPASGSSELSFLVYGDMGKAPLDPSAIHYIQPGSISVIKAIEKEIKEHTIDSIFHIGDISYATGFLVEWEYFLHLIQPIASHVSYMTAIGNHESDFPGSKSMYISPDSVGECGVPYASHFQMPMCTKDKPWYSIEQGPVHFAVASTEHDWSTTSVQFKWMQDDLSSINRTKTPWLIFVGHRPMYSSNLGIQVKFPALGVSTVDIRFCDAVEPLLIDYKVDLVLFGHIHNYERTCAVYQDECKGMPVKDKDGVDIYDNNNYTAPVHVMAGMAGYKLDDFPNVTSCSLVRLSEFGFGKVHATKTDLLFQFINSTSTEVRDSFRIIKKLS